MPSMNASARATVLVTALRAAYDAAGSQLSFFQWLDTISADEAQAQRADAAELLEIVRSEHVLTEVQLNDKYSDGRWGNHPIYPSADWRTEVDNEETRQGYWPWVLSQMDQDLAELA